MAVTLNRILNDSQQAAMVYGSLVEAANVDEKAWDFVEMRKDHEQIVGSIRRMLAEMGMDPGGQGPGASPQIRKQPHLRLYEDPEVLNALREAEQSELADCDALMGQSAGDREIHTFVANQIRPVLSNHVEVLSDYLKRARARRH
ncbi:hypothetical protein ACXYTJ_15990 [Gilvimarinus sp. F26214L]|uniref:hypothetical protein n=1 Tax=Gilvimarinus sp. DZF01 TaxID=3461371 RepID=UPI00404567A3